VPIDALTAYAHVEDVPRSIEFYRRLGLDVENTHTVEGRLVWALLTRGEARLMVALGEGPIDAANQAVGAVTYPFYMPAGELRVEDPDGYVLLAGQLGEPG
jgi:hypothetical protein